MESGELRGEWRLGVLCAAVVALCLALTAPLAEIGLIDDWSYIFSSQVLARTGRLTYNGWTTAMLGPQLYWGALFTLLFGENFTAPRISTMVLLAGCGPLLFAIGRQCGLTRAHSVLAALTVCLSPLALPVGTMFMSDIPGLFLFLATLWAALRARTAPGRSGTLAWLLAAVVLGVLAGSTRQIYWLLPALIPPVVAWERRATPGVAPAAAALWVAGLAVSVAGHLWFLRQPYSLQDSFPLRFALSHPERLGVMVYQFVLLLFTGLVLLLPVLAIAAKRPALRPWQWACAVLAGAVCLTFSVALRPAMHEVHYGPEPWLGTTFGAYGVMSWGMQEGLGRKPLPVPVWLCRLWLVAAVSLAAALLFRLAARRTSPASIRGPLVFTVLFVLGYCGLVALRGIGQYTWDRYCLPLTVLAAIGALRAAQTNGITRPPRMAWALLALQAVFSVAYTHDYFAARRARVAAANLLEARSVPRTAIDGGFEYNAWTELLVQGYVNDDRLRNPPGAYQRYPPLSFAPDCLAFHRRLAPHVRPVYSITFSEGQPSCLLPEPDHAVPYRAWLPPFERSLLIRRFASPGS